MLVYDKEEKDFVNAKEDRKNIILKFPGFYNGHSHVAMTLLKGIAENMNLKDWLNNVVWPIEENLTKKDIYYSSLLGFYEMLSTGITSFNDMYWKYIDLIAKAAEDIGINGYVCYDVAFKKDLKDLRRFLKKKYKFIKAGVAVHSIYKAEPALIKEAYNISNDFNTIFHIHAAETREELFYSLKNFGKRPIEFLIDLNVVKENTFLAHASWVTTQEIKKIANSKATIVHCPTSNLKLATGGICPLHEYQTYNANISIGTDSVASNNSFDFFFEIKIASLLQKHRYWQADIPDLKSLFYSAITKEFNSNFITIKKDLSLIPFYNPFYALFYSASKKNISDVMINKKYVIKNGQIDEKHKKNIERATYYIEKTKKDIERLLNNKR
jgi:cytosine/adenosine deaminase-related metal-dependent hydrolase